LPPLAAVERICDPGYLDVAASVIALLKRCCCWKHL